MRRNSKQHASKPDRPATSEERDAKAPTNFRSLTEKYRCYSTPELTMAVGSLGASRGCLRASLQCWLLALVARKPCAMKRVNHIWYSRREIKFPEFVALFRGDAFSDATRKCRGQLPSPELEGRPTAPQADPLPYQRTFGGLPGEAWGGRDDAPRDTPSNLRVGAPT